MASARCSVSAPTGGFIIAGMDPDLKRDFLSIRRSRSRAIAAGFKVGNSHAGTPAKTGRTGMNKSRCNLIKVKLPRLDVLCLLSVREDSG